MKYLKTKLVFGATLLLFIIIGNVYAAFQLEVDFPTIGGERLVSISTLPQVIKYGLNAFLLVSVLAVVVSLIYGGITYLNSTGRPDVMTKARSRIIGSGFGLGLVLLSVLLLQIVNPELAVPKINKVPVATGALFLNDEAYRILTNPDSNKPEEVKIRDDILNPIDESVREARLQELLNNPASEPRAAYALWNISDMTDYFGELEVDKDRPIVAARAEDDPRFQYQPFWIDPLDPAPDDEGKKKYNFQNFKLYGLLLLDNNIEVTTYYFSEYNALTEGRTGYFKIIFRGFTSFNPEWLDEIITLWNKRKFDDTAINKYGVECSILQGKPCKLKMLDGQFANGEISFTEKKSVPFSLRIEYQGKGVYLRSDEFGQTLPFLGASAHIPYLNIYDFNDKTTKIEIKNWDVFQDEAGKVKAEKKTNFLAILHEGENFKGDLRVFFEQLPGPGGGRDFGNLPTNAPDGPTPENEAVKNVKQNKIDEYGKIDQASSLQVFQMPQTREDWDKWKRQGGCTVKICAQRSDSPNPEYFQDCLIYDFSDRTGKNTFPSSPPAQKGGQPGPPLEAFLFKPFSIPQGKVPQGKVTVYKRGDAKGDYGDEIGTAKLYDNVNSMQIEGNCVVVLFENNIHKEREAKCEQEPDKCWDKGGPGEHSEVFSPYDSEYPNYLDLTPTNIDKNRPKHEIGYCRSAIWPLGSYQSCVSSIVIFPLKIGD